MRDSKTISFSSIWRRFRSEWDRTIPLPMLLITGLILLADIVEDLFTENELAQTDHAVFRWLQAWRTGALDHVLIAITELGDSLVVLTVTAVVSFWLASRRCWRALIYWLLTIGGASLLNTVIKGAIQRPRPVEVVNAGWSAYSFPSGHSTTNIVLYGFATILLWRHVGPRNRLCLLAVVFLLAGGIGISRLYLGAHWLSDVVGGLAFGMAWASALGIAYLRGPREDLDASRLQVVILAALIVAGSANVVLSHQLDLERYQILQEKLGVPPSSQPGFGAGR